MILYWCVKFFLNGNAGERHVWASTASEAQDAVIKVFKNCNIISCERIKL